MERRTLLLVSVFLALLGVYLLVEVVLLPRRAALVRGREEVVPFSPEEIAEIRLGSGVRVTLDTGRPRLVEPVEAPAAPAATDALLRALGHARWERRVAIPRDSLASYGLAPPRATATVRARDGRGVTLELGDESPAGKSVYARARESGVVGLVSDELTRALTVGADLLRDRRLIAASPREVTGIRIERPSGVLSLARDDRGAWRIAQPIAARASAQKVSALLQRLLTEEATSFLDSREDSLGLASARVTGIRSVALQEGPSAETLSVRSFESPAYALVATVSSQRRPVVADPRLLDVLDADAESLREDRLFLRGPGEAVGIEVALGADTLVIERDAPDAETWRIVRPESLDADPTRVRAFLRNLDITRIKGPSRAASPALAGTDAPRGRLRLRFTDPPSVEGFVVGARAPEGGADAAWENAPEIFVIPEPMMERLSPDPAEFETRRLLAGPLAGAKRVSLVFQGGGAPLERREVRRDEGPGGAWAHLVERLSAIEYIDRVPVLGADSSLGFAPPYLLVEWDGRRNGRLEIGAFLDASRRFARLSGRRGIYIVSAADIDSIGPRPRS